MFLDRWFTDVHPSGRVRLELLDRDQPAAWAVDATRHRAEYTGRIVEDHEDSSGRLVRGVLRRYTLSFDLPAGVYVGPGLGVRPPTPSPTPTTDSTSDEEDPSELPPSVGVRRGFFSSVVSLDASDIPSSSGLLKPKRESAPAPSLMSRTPACTYRVDPLVHVTDEVIRSDMVDVETGEVRQAQRTVRRELIDLETEVLTIVDSDDERLYEEEEEEEQ